MKWTIVVALAACGGGSGGSGSFTGALTIEGEPVTLDESCKRHDSDYYDLSGIADDFGVELKWKTTQLSGPGELVTTGSITDPIVIFGVYRSKSGMNEIINGAGTVTFSRYAPDADGFAGHYTVQDTDFTGSGDFDCP